MAHQQTTTVVVAPTQPSIQTAVVVHKKEGNACRAAIPAMHIAMAVTCLILNIFIPGFGTIIAGFSVFCCANPGQSGGGKFGTMCLNFWVGLLQLFTTAIFLIGWIWSIMWGAAFIAMSSDYHSTNRTTTTLVTTSTPGQQGVVITSPPQHPPQGQPYVVPPQQGYPQPPPQQQGYPPQQPSGYPPPQQTGSYPAVSPQHPGYAPVPQQDYRPAPQQGYPGSEKQGYPGSEKQGYPYPAAQQSPPQGYGGQMAMAPPHVASAPPPQGDVSYPPQPAFNPQHGGAAPPPYAPNEPYPQKQ